MAAQGRPWPGYRAWWSLGRSAGGLWHVPQGHAGVQGTVMKVWLDVLRAGGFGDAGPEGHLLGRSRGRQPENVRQPRFGGRGAEAGVDVEAVGSERVDAPAGTERSPQLALGDAARAPVAGLTVAEAHEVKVATWTEDGVHGGDVPGAGGVVEDVEQPAVDDRVEGLAERVEA